MIIPLSTAVLNEFVMIWLLPSPDVLISLEVFLFIELQCDPPQNEFALTYVQSRNELGRPPTPLLKRLL